MNRDNVYFELLQEFLILALILIAVGPGSIIVLICFAALPGIAGGAILGTLAILGIVRLVNRRN